ncbi:MAG: aryl-sulfate sulfotransferase [Candidatus Thorarchaeota archaeon]|jgi:hypothetical protein
MSSSLRVIIFFLLLLTVNIGPSTDAATQLKGIERDNPQFQETAFVSGAEVMITKTIGAFEGYNLFVLFKRSIKTEEHHLFLIIVDMNGEVFLEKYLGTEFWSWPAELIDPRTILVRANDSALLYDLTDGSMTLLPFEGHHEYEYNPFDDTFFTLHFNEIEIDNETYLFDKLVEFDREGNIVWEFDITSLMSVVHWCPYQDYYWDLPDISHLNTVFFDAEDDSIYLLSRNANTFWKINYSSGDVIWGLGEYGNFTLYNEWGQSKDNLFFHAHAVERVDDDTFILFDNDLHNQTDELNEVSRIIEISIDEDTMTANTSWTWSAAKEYYSPWWGDADRLPNRNRMGVFGILGFEPSQYGARIVEVNEEHEIMWEMAFVNDESYWYGVYRNERFQFHPILQVLEAENTYTEDDITVNFGAWFNYRPKWDVPGSYTLYIDDVSIKNGTVTFDRYWRPTIIPCTFHNLRNGPHNATLVVYGSTGQSARVTAEFVVAHSETGDTLLVFTVIIVGFVGLVVLWIYRRR